MPADLEPAPRPFSRFFDDPDEYASSVFRGRGNIVGGVPRCFQARLDRIEFGNVDLRRAEASEPVMMRGAVPRYLTFMFAERSAPSRVMSGRTLSSGTLFHPRPDDTVFARRPPVSPWPWISLGIPYEALERAAGALAGHDVAPLRLDAALITPPEFARFRLLRLAGNALGLIAARPAVVDSPAASLALAGTLTDALVNCVASTEIEFDRAVARRRHAVMKRLVQVLEERPDEMLALSSLCAATGVSRHSLNEICYDFTGQSVVRYVRDHRLGLVRLALLAADPAKATVATVAMEYGFWELGRFAAAYRALFGELPSVTLRRNSDYRLRP